MVMNGSQLIAFIKEKEKIFNEHTTAKEKWLILNKLILSFKIPSKPLIIDVGGGAVTAHIIKNWFPVSDIFTININKNSLNNIPSQYIKADIELDSISKCFGRPASVVFLMDVIEHLYDPDKALKNLTEVLSQDGYLIISTPNLADFYNRFFLLFGYALHNYNVSQWYKTGNPFIKDLSGKRHGNHKSVFTIKQLTELLEQVYRLKVIHSNGYSYYEQDWLEYYGKEERLQIQKDATIIGHKCFRNLFNRVLPDSMKEGILIIAKNC